jgi:hypothetical protein
MTWSTVGRMAVGLLANVIMLSAANPGTEISQGDLLPPLKGEFLTGRDAVLPQAASGRVALLLLGFTYESRFSVEAWAKRFRHDFEKEPKVTFFEIPMIGGLARMGKWFIESGMRRGTPQADRENVITVYGGTDLWKQRLGFHDPAIAYLILVDQRGRVVWRHAGNLEEKRYQALSSEVLRLIASR